MGEPDFFSEKEKKIYIMLTVIGPVFKKTVDKRRGETDLDQIYSKAREIFDNEGEQPLINYIESLSDLIIIDFFSYLIGKGLEARAEHMPKHYLRQRK